MASSHAPLARMDLDRHAWVEPLVLAILGIATLVVALVWIGSLFPTVLQIVSCPAPVNGSLPAGAPSFRKP